jgi:hypothetical protein
MPRRIQLSRKKGWRLPPNSKVVARPTRWGNPFRAETPEQRAPAVARFRRWIDSQAGEQLRDAAKSELRGFHLACWCPLDGPCHADVLLEIANADD